MTAQQMWDAYGQKIGEEKLAGKSYTAWHFCNDEQGANALYPLVLSGQKQATTACLWVFEAEGEPVPKPGDLSIILDWEGNARCIIETTEVDIVPYAEVTEEFAAIEGEGDGSLAYWRRVHIEFFREECESIGREFTEDMPAVCEQFRVAYRPE
jgi:uncharacterized protein YhfF